jgi:hypothetical protein
VACQGTEDKAGTVFSGYGAGVERLRLPELEGVMAFGKGAQFKRAVLCQAYAPDSVFFSRIFHVNLPLPEIRRMSGTYFYANIDPS